MQLREEKMIVGYGFHSYSAAKIVGIPPTPKTLAL
jgi:hypothetical protein